MEYLSPQGVLLPLVYGTTASPLWLELRGRSAWQATPSWTVYRLACHRLPPWLRVTFAMVPDAAWPGSDQQPWSTATATGLVGRLSRPSVSDPWAVGSFLSPGRPTCVRCPGPPGSCSPVCPLGVLCCVCGVLGQLAPVHRCARSVCCVGCAVSWASWLLFTGVPARCVVLRVRCPGPPGSCSPVCPLRALFRVCGVLGHLAPVHRCARSVCCSACAVSLGPLAPVHRCARSVCCFACAVSWASWLLFTGVPARCVVLGVRCPGPNGSCSPVCPLGALFRVCGILGLLAPVHRCARSVCCVACAVSWASWLLFTGVPARRVFLRVRCPGPPGSCSPVCPLGVLCCVCGVLGLLAPVQRCARSVRCFVCAASWATWLLFTGVPARCVVLRVRFPWAPLLLFTGVPARCVVLRVRCPGPPGSCSPVCPLGVLCCVCGVLGLMAPVHRCARSVRCFACAASWATWLLFTGVPARRVVLRVRCPGPPGSCSPLCPPGVLFCVCGVLGLVAPVHRCARSVCCVECAVSWASWLLFTGVPARCVVSRVRRPGPPGSCSPVRPLGVLCCVCGVLGLLAPVHRCARLVRCFACAVSWASWLLFGGVPARCVVLRVRCPGPTGSCSPVCSLGVLCWVCAVLGLLAPVHRCARLVCCVACAVSWASWLLFTGVPAPCVVSRVRRPGPPGSCSLVCRSVCCSACAVSWAPWLLFTGVPARCVVLRVRCPGPPGSCSPVRPLGVLCCVCGVLGHLAPVHPVCPLGVLLCVCGVLGQLAPVHRCARSVCCFACAVSWANWLLFTGVPARCVVLRVRCPGPPGSCSPVCPLGVLCCVCGVLGLLAPVHRCARSVCCVACAVSWATWVFFAGAPARCVVLRVRCLGPPGSCSPVCLLGVLFCVCGVLGLLAPVHRCAHSVCCFACAVSWASWLLFTGVPARCVVLRVRCPGPTGSCSPVCPLGVLCCCAGRRCGALIVHPDGDYRSRQGLGTLGAHTRPSGRRLLVAGRGWVPSGRALVHPHGGCSSPAGAGYPPGAHSSIRTAAVRSRQGLGTLRSRTRPSGRRLACVCVLFVAGSGGPASRARCGAPHLFLWPLCLTALLGPLRAGVVPLSLTPLPFLVALALCFGCFSRPPAAWLFVCSRLVCVSRLAVGCSLVVSPPPPFCVSQFSSLLPGALVFFFFFFCFFFFSFPCAPPLSPAFSGFRPRVPLASALGVVCFVGLLLLGSPCACPSFLLSAWLLAAPWWLLPPPPPFCLAVFVAAARCCVPCAVRPGVRCCAALLRVVSSGVVLSCAVLRSFGAAACCAVHSGAARRPGALCSAALCFAVFPRAVCPVLCVFCRGAVVRAVVRRSALCCVCSGVLCCAFPVLSALCGAVLRCAGALALCCSCGACCWWRLVLWCAVVRCWLWWPVVVCWWRDSVSLSLSGRVVCFPVVGVVCCGALLSCVVFCGAVLSRGAVLLCSAVMLRCCWGLLCPPVGCRAVLCCAVGWLCLFLPGGGVCVLWCSFPRAVRSLSSPLCALRCLVVLAVVPCFPVSCAVALCCRVVLCCRALLSFCGAVCVCFALLRPVVRRQCRLRCCWCLVLWRVPVRCGVSLGVLRCGGAALVCRGVLLCCALSCGVLHPVPCPAVRCCPAVLCWLAVLCGCLRCFCLFFLLSSFPLLKTPAVFPCL